MIAANDALRQAIMNNPTPKQVEDILVNTRFARLMPVGYQLVAQGVTAYDEIDKVVGH
jgi:type II secretory ATPase GspE/PulE/Tfp pilus assembly ATPase PilB-like protein